MKRLAALLEAGSRLIPYALGLLAFAAIAPAQSAEYPERLIRVIVPFATGGPNDLIARLVAPQLSKMLGQSVVVENRPGAAGNIGIEAVAKSAPDGYTLLVSANASTGNAALFRTLRYDPINDIQPVAVIAESPYAIVVNAHLPVKNLSEFVKLARANPGKLNASAAGIGTRLAVELFKIQNKLSLEIITYNGTGPAALSVATGEADFAITDTSGFMPFMPSGRVRLLAVAGDKRLYSFPNVPTTAEAGLPAYKTGTTVAIYVVTKTPTAIVQKLNTALNSITVMPEVSEQLQKMGGYPAPKTVEQFTHWYRSEIPLWKNVVARAKIPLEE